MIKKEQIYQYLGQNMYMALATATLAGKPEVATVKYVLDGDKLLFNTSTKYRKYQNLIQNMHVACVVTTGHERTLQLDGVVAEFKDSQAEQAKQKLVAADPEFEKWFHPDTRFFAITPTWLRLRDYTKTPMRVIELTLS